MQNNITFNNLCAFGYSNYYLTADGKLYKTKPKAKQMTKDKYNRYFLINDNGIGKKITVKELYRQCYHKEFCNDNIINLCNEEWKPIAETENRYYISNYGRVKSVCGYTAKILQAYEKQNGYLVVKIDGKNRLIHQLVAFAFCENKYKGQRVEIHHIDKKRNNNYYKNLLILSIAEHHKIHAKETTDNE